MSVAVSEALLLPMVTLTPAPTATLVPLVFVSGAGVLTEAEVGFVVGIPSMGLVSVPGGQVVGGRHGGGHSRGEPGGVG